MITDILAVARTTEDITLALDDANGKETFIEELKTLVKPADVQPLNDLDLQISSYLKEKGYTPFDPVTNEPLQVIQGVPAVMLGIAKGDYLGDIILHAPDNEQPAQGYYYKTNWLFLRNTQLSEEKAELDRQCGDLAYALMNRFDVRIDLHD